MFGNCTSLKILDISNFIMLQTISSNGILTGLVNISYIKSIGFDSLKDNKIKWVKFRGNNMLRDFLEKFDIEKIVLIRIFYIIENLWIIIGNN